MSATRRDFIQGALAAGVVSGIRPAQAADSDLHDDLWYSGPANRWLEALPVGNGRLGAMIFGGIQTERIALSESTAWSGAPATGEVNPGAREHLNEIRQLFFVGKYEEAQELCGKYLVGHAKNFGTNLPLPELQFAFDNPPAPDEYRRSLRLEDAVARVRLRSGKTIFQREMFASHSDKILVIRLTCSDPGKISFRMSFDNSILPTEVKTDGQDTLVLDGHVWERLHSTGHDGVALQVRAHLIAEGGERAGKEKAIAVNGANAVTVLVAIGTSFQGGNPDTTCRKIIQSAARKTYALLLDAHKADYQPLYRRVSIDLGRSSPAISNQPTEVRRKALEDGADDPQLLALFFSVRPLPYHRRIPRGFSITSRVAGHMERRSG